MVDNLLEIVQRQCHKTIPCGFDFHATLTSLLPRHNEHKFSKVTPKPIRSAIKRLWDPDTGVFTFSERIVQDVQRVGETLKSLLKIMDMMPGVADCNGHRNLDTSTNEDESPKPYYPPHKDQTAEDLEDLDLYLDC